MADGDRPIVLVPLATARKAARRAGVTLNLSADDIALAGKWKHGWIPLDAVASAVKAKRYHGGGGEGRTVKGKGRAGSAVESRREPSRGRTKIAPTGAARNRMTPREVDATRLPNGEKMGGSNDHLTSLGQRNAIFRRQGLPEQEPGENKADHGRRVAKVIDERGRKAHAEYSARQWQFDDRLLSTAPGAIGEAARARLRQASGGPRREPHISAEPLKDGRHNLTDSKSGESVKAVHLASFHSQGHTITGVRNGQMHTRDDYGKAHVYDPATGRAATASASLADHARTHSDASLRDLTRRFSEGTAEGRAVRAEIARRQSAALLEGKSAGSMRARRDSMGVLVRPTGPVTSTSSGLPSGYRITNDEFGPALYSNGKLLRTTSKGNEHNLVQYAKDHAAGDTSAHPRTVQDQLDAAKAGKASLDGRSAASMSAAERARAAEIMHGTGSKQHRKALATARVQQTAQDRHRSVEAARGEPKLADLSESDLRGLISRYGEKSVQADAARAEMLRRGLSGHAVSKRSKPLNLPSGYEVRPDRVQVAPGVTQPGSSFSAYGPDGMRVHHAARSESEAARMARKHHERATEGERQRLEAAAARSAAAGAKRREQSAWDARMAAGTARHKVTTDAIAERRKAEPILLRIRAGMLSKDALTALADDPSAGRYERVAAHRALTALASRRLATATPAQLDQVESVAASAKGLAPSERDAFLRASAARRRKLKRGGR